jgi:hypothetical protein
MFNLRVTNLSPGSGATKRLEETMSPIDRNDLLEHKHKKESATRTKQSVVNLEEESELLWLTCLHNLADAEDSGEIARKNTKDDWLGRKWGRAAYIMSQVVGEIREGGMFEKKIRETSHDETKRRGREEARTRVGSHSKRRPAPKSSDCMIGI